jgi:hypothetical protein
MSNCPNCGVALPAPASAEPCIWYESVVSGLKYGNPSAAGDISAVIVLGKRYVAAPSPAPAEPVRNPTAAEVRAYRDKHCVTMADAKAALTPKAAPTPAVGAEPVAWMSQDGCVFTTADWSHPMSVEALIVNGNRPLYAAPTPEVEQRVREDAARYRYIRENYGTEYEGPDCRKLYTLIPDVRVRSSEDVDAAIDRMRLAGEGK